jgi:hypothetical protein
LSSLRRLYLSKAPAEGEMGAGALQQHFHRESAAAGRTARCASPNYEPLGV